MCTWVEERGGVGGTLAWTLRPWLKGVSELSVSLGQWGGAQMGLSYSCQWCAWLGYHGSHVARRAQRRLGPRGLISPFITLQGGG